MLQITPQHKLLIATNPVDFRCGIDSLKAKCQGYFQVDPFNGYVFVFRNRTGTSVKLLVYDGNGFWLCQKRFSTGRLKWWPKTQQEADHLHAVELTLILQQGSPAAANVPLDWRNLPSFDDNSRATSPQGFL